ncbi:MAG: hypothetical protein H0U18_05475 [Pyrinomonadaceae bacterium]|nr:hypothetical protein [Pyrinomonadaceae bacterium]
MSVRLEYGGVSIECETAEEAVFMVRMLASGSTNGRSQSATSKTTSKQPSLTAIVKGLGDKQKSALRHIVAAGGTANDTLLRQKLNVEGSGLGGVLGGITKGAARAGIDPKRLFQKSIDTGADGERIRLYTIPEEAIEEVRKGLN